MKNLYIKTYGCDMNKYDSSAMANILRESHQLELIDDPEKADVLLINTCAIRHKAEEKFFSELGVWRSYKEANPNIIIGVGGCVASQEGSNIRRRATYVDLIFGPQTIHRLPKLLDEILVTKKTVMDISFPEIEKFDHLPAPRAEGIKAFVSIMEGCSKYCSYCVVPYTRGEEINRPLDDVLKEIHALSQKGVREITLLGQNVNDYRGKMPDGQIADLALLIHIIAKIDGVLRIRFSTSHPLAFSDRLINAYATEPKLANQLHLPIQSGSDRILSAMKRGYTALEFKSKIKKLRAVRPDISITSDFIVGFPNETEDDFNATLKLVDDIGFDNSFSFIYSKRPGTPAANLQDTISLDIKKARLAVLQKKLSDSMAKFSQNLLHTHQIILMESPTQGRTESNRLVRVDSPQEIGSLVRVKITDTSRHILAGEKGNEIEN